MILIIFGAIAVLTGGYLLYFGASSLFSETEGTASSRVSRVVAAIVGLGIIGLGVAMLVTR